MFFAEITPLKRKSFTNVLQRKNTYQNKLISA